jgi:hypothetical protein
MGCRHEPKRLQAKFDLYLTALEQARQFIDASIKGNLFTF